MVIIIPNQCLKKRKKNQNFDNQGKNLQIKKNKYAKKRNIRFTKGLLNQRSTFFEGMFALFPSHLSPTLLHHSLFYGEIKHVWHTGRKIYGKYFSHKTRCKILPTAPWTCGFGLELGHVVLSQRFPIGFFFTNSLLPGYN